MLRLAMCCSTHRERLVVESSVLHIGTLSLRLNRSFVETVSAYATGIQQQVDYFRSKAARAADKDKHRNAFEQSGAPGDGELPEPSPSQATDAKFKVFLDSMLRFNNLAAVQDVFRLRSSIFIEPFFQRCLCPATRVHVHITAAAFTALIRAAGKGHGTFSRNLSFLLPRLMVPKQEIPIDIPLFQMLEREYSGGQIKGTVGLVIPMTSVLAAWHQTVYPAVLRQVLHRLSASLGNRIFGVNLAHSMLSFAKSVAAASSSSLQNLPSRFSQLAPASYRGGNALARFGRWKNSSIGGDQPLWRSLLDSINAIYVSRHQQLAMSEPLRSPYRSRRFGPWYLGNTGQWTYVAKQNPYFRGCDLVDVCLVPQNQVLGFKIIEVCACDVGLCCGRGRGRGRGHGVGAGFVIVLHLRV